MHVHCGVEGDWELDHLKNLCVNFVELEESIDFVVAIFRRCGAQEICLLHTKNLETKRLWDVNVLIITSTCFAPAALRMLAVSTQVPTVLDMQV